MPVWFFPTTHEENKVKGKEMGRFSTVVTLSRKRNRRLLKRTRNVIT